MKKYKSIEEVKVVPKKKIGFGMEHDVYPSMNPDLVYKIPKGKILKLEWLGLNYFKNIQICFLK
jgi:hypothetical protein